MLQYLSNSVGGFFMSFSGFTKEDFDVFSIDGLDQRMDALKELVRPKLEYLGNYFAPSLTALTGQEMYAHVAKHARRTINPPKDTWVAFANNNRGYKMLPHFQIGLWETHLFIWFAIIYECPLKNEIGQKLELNINKVFKTTPSDFSWSEDHTKPDSKEHQSFSKKELQSTFERLSSIKKAELLCGYQIPQEVAIKMDPDQLLKKIDSVFNGLMPLYKIIYR
jgi:uncharacterized protein YktB (UPF0637 family)